MNQDKPTAARTDSLFIDRLRNMHGDLRAVGTKAVECVLPAKIQAKAADFLHGLQNAPDKPIRAMDAIGFAVDILLFTPSMSGHTAIDRAIGTGKVGDAEMEAANLLRQATFRLLEITEDLGGGLLSATDLVSDERLTLFDPQSPMARGGCFVRRTCLYQDVHVTVGPVTPLNDGMLAVAAPFMDKGRGLKKPHRCAEALYKYFIRHCDPLDGVNLDFLDDDDDEFPFDASDGPLHALAADWAEESQLPEPDEDVLQLIRSEAYEEPVLEIHRASYYAHQIREARLAAAYDRILSLQLETIHRRASVGIRASFETLDSLTEKLKEGRARGEVPADAIAHFEEMCRRVKLAGNAKTNKGNREELDKVLSRIQALRAKTVEQGCTEAEALLAASKVAELLDQYGLTLSEIDMKSQRCSSEGIETNRRRRSAFDDCAGLIAIFCDCRSWYEMTPQGIRHIFFGLPADVAGARYLYERIEQAFETETAEFKRSELYQKHPSAKRRSATTSFQAGLGHGICAKLDRLKAERAEAFRASGGRDLVPVKRDVIEDELAALGMRLKTVQSGRKNLLAMAYKKGRVTGENLEWEEKLVHA